MDVAAEPNIAEPSADAPDTAATPAGPSDSSPAPAAPPPAVRVDVDAAGAIATITLDRPERRNALAVDVMEALCVAIRDVAASDARGIVLAATGPVFSAGHNFADMAGASAEEATAIFALCTEMMTALHQAPQPVCARVHALATAAGCQLVASCDLAVAGRSAAFALPGGKGGLFCHTPLVAVARQIGRKRALEMAFTGDTVDAVTAQHWGLVNAVVDDDELDAAVADLLARATRGSALSKGLGKRAFYAQIEMPPAGRLRVCRGRHGRCRGVTGGAGGHRRLPRQAPGQLHPLTPAPPRRMLAARPRDRFAPSRRSIRRRGR